MSMTMPLAIPGLPTTNVSTQSEAGIQLNFSTQVSGEINAETNEGDDNSAEHGPERFKDLLASLLAAFSHHSCAQPHGPAPVAPGSGESAPTEPALPSAQANASVDLDVSNTMALDLSFTSMGLQRLASLRSSLDVSLEASLNGAGIQDLGNSVIDAVADTVKEAVQTHLAGHPHLDMAAELSASLSIGSNGVDLDLDLNSDLSMEINEGSETTTSTTQPSTSQQDIGLQGSTSTTINTSSAMTQQESNEQSQTNQQNISLLTFENANSMVQEPDNHDQATTETRIDANFSSILSGKVEATPHAPETVTAVPVASAAAAPVVHTQLVEAVEPLSHRADGSYDITLELHPAELGAVRVRAVLENGTIQLHIQAERATTQDMLQNSLANLRTALDDAGLNTGQLSVGAHPNWQDQTSQSGQQQASINNQGAASPNDHRDVESNVSIQAETSDTVVDILL